jgi:hypothetical protein
MNVITAKFKVGSVTDFGNKNFEVKMTPVTGGSEENKSFSLYTPSGDVRLHVTEPSAANFFEPSKEYYLTFSKTNIPEHNVHNNAIAFRDFLDTKGIEFKANGHFTTIIGCNDIFSLGCEWEKYAMINNPDYKK